MLQNREPEDCLFSRSSMPKCRSDIHATLIQEFICLKYNHRLDPSYKNISDMDLERGVLTACLEEGHVPLVNGESHSSPKGASHNSVLALLLIFFPNFKIILPALNPFHFHVNFIFFPCEF